MPATSVANVTRPDLAISVQRSATEATVTLSGEIDMSTVGRLTKAIDDLLSPAPPRVVLDLGGVTFCDSQGLGTLVVLSRRTSLAHSHLILVNLQDFLLRVLDITGLRGALTIREDTA